MSASSIFVAYLGEIEASVRFFRDAVQLRPRLGGFLNWGAAGAEERELIGSFLGRSPIEDRIYGAAVVSICAGMEQFTADLIDEVCDVVNAKKLDAEAAEAMLPGILRKQRRYAGHPLDKVEEPRAYWKISYDDLVLSLATTVRSSQAVILHGRAFAVNVGGVDPESIERAFSRLSIDVPWVEISKSKSLQKALGTSAQAETNFELRKMLEDLSRLRNALAHSQGAEVVGFEKLSRIISGSRHFSEEISKLVLKRVA